MRLICLSMQFAQLLHPGPWVGLHWLKLQSGHPSLLMQSLAAATVCPGNDGVARGVRHTET